MTYAGQETSREGSRPVELYKFALAGTLFPFTSAEQEVIADAVTYEPETIKRSKLVNTPEQKENQLNVTLPATNTFAKLFVNVIPGERASITVFQQHLTDTPTPENVAIFKGFVSTVSFSANGKVATVLCRPLTSAAGRPMPRQTYQGLCNHMLYDPRCSLLQANFEETGDVIAVSGRTVTLDSTFTNLTGDYWEAGFVQFGNEFRLIVAQTNDVMKLNLPFAESPLSQAVKAVPGCKHRLSQDCITKFSNGDNYGGFPYVPKKNPFSTGLD